MTGQTQTIRNNNVNGIAVSPIIVGNNDDDQMFTDVFFSPLGSLSMFAVGSTYLKDEAIATDSDQLGQYIEEYPSKRIFYVFFKEDTGKDISLFPFSDKPSQNDGLMFGAGGRLYITEIATNAITG